MKEQNTGNYFLEGHLNEEAFALYADALILGKENRLPDVILDHAESCQQCKKEIFALYTIMQKDGIIQGTEVHPILDQEEIKNTNDSHNHKGYQILKYAAIFFGAICLSTLIYFMVSQHPDNKNSYLTYTSDSNKRESLNHEKKIINSKKDTIDSSVKKAEVAMSMRESVIFESLINSHYRDEGIEVVSPSLRHRFTNKEKVVFKFKGNLSVPYHILIYNNKGEKILEKDNISAMSYTPGIKLSSGLYYWKLEKDDNLLYVGKFYIQRF